MPPTRLIVFTAIPALGLLVACGGTASVAPSSVTAAASASLASTARPSTPPSASPAGAAPISSASAKSSGAASPAASGQAASSSGLQATVANQVATAVASLSSNGTYACGQMTQGAAKGKVIIEVPQIEQAVGFKVNSVVPYPLSGALECEYNFDTPAGGASLKLGIDQNTSKAKDDFAAVQTKRISLLDGGCNGCTLTDITPIPGLGDSAYKAKRNGDPTDVAVLKGPLYFEIDSLNLKEERLLNMAHAIVDGQA